MHADLEKLINFAKETGELTEKQREIILRKADALGEDRDEVVFVLETLKTRTNTNSESGLVEKKKKCPNCGAVISETVFQCPECGYTLQKENKASEDARKLIDGLQESLLKAAEPLNKTEQWMNPLAPAQRQANVINMFTLPTTKEGLMQLLDFSYSNYISIGNDASGAQQKPLKDAWYGKAIQSLNMLDRIGKGDPDIQSRLLQYRGLILNEKKKLSYQAKVIIGVVLTFVVCLILCFLGMKFSK